MKTYSLMSEDFTQNMNVVKDEIFQVLEREGKLSEGNTAELLSKKYAVIAVEPNWLGSLIAKFWKEELRDKLAFQVVKIV